MFFKKVAIIAILVLASTTSAHAGFLDWLFNDFGNGGGGGGGDTFCVPEIDALSGMATSAVVISIALIIREKLFRK